MRNLSALGTIHSPIDADRDAKAYSTDWKALGLPDHSPFDILRQPHAEPRERAPKKPGKTQRERVIASLADLPGTNHFNVDIASRQESDRTLAIAGRRIV